MDQIMTSIGNSMDYKGYEQLLRTFGDLLYNEYYDVPLFDDYTLAGVNPKTVGYYQVASSFGYDGMEYVKKP